MVGIVLCAFLYDVRHGSEQNSFLPSCVGMTYLSSAFCSLQCWHDLIREEVGAAIEEEDEEAEVGAAAEVDW